MITPRFSCSQTEEAVIISIHCPSVRASDVEIHVDETLFTVYINPYYLRLSFSHPVLEDDESSARYDPSSGDLTVTLTKSVKGQMFTDLDLLAKLLAPPASGVMHHDRLIEVVDTEDHGQCAEDELVSGVENLSLDKKDILEAASNDWQFNQQLPEPLATTTQRFYGFLDMHSEYFRHVQYTENEVNDLGSDAESCTPQERRERRLEREENKWDEEYYLADFADDEYIQELIAWRHPHCSPQGDVIFTDEENMMMLRLPRKEYLPTAEQTEAMYHTLVTVLFSYAYDSRTTQHDPTPESGWTISVLTPAFSALDPAPYPPLPSTNASPVASKLAPAFVASYRRSLAFPLYRSFALAEACRSDVATFLNRGRRCVLRCLLESKRILDHHEVYYVYSKIWVDDLCVWIQSHASDEALRNMAAATRSLEMKKEWIGWDLEGLESLTQGDANSRLPDSDDEDSEDEVGGMLPTT